MAIELNKMNQVVFYCDFHGHSKNLGIFAYGNTDNDSPEKYRVFPYLLSELNRHFSYKKSRFVVQKSKNSTARIVMWKEFMVPNIFTIEASFFGPLNGTAHFSTYDLKELGKNVCIALSQYEKSCISTSEFLSKTLLRMEPEFQQNIMKNFNNENNMQGMKNMGIINESSESDSDEGSDSNPSDGNIDPEELDCIVNPQNHEGEVYHKNTQDPTESLLYQSEDNKNTKPSANLQIRWKKDSIFQKSQKSCCSNYDRNLETDVSRNSSTLPIKELGMQTDSVKIHRETAILPKIETDSEKFCPVCQQNKHVNSSTNMGICKDNKNAIKITPIKYTLQKHFQELCVSKSPGASTLIQKLQRFPDPKSSSNLPPKSANKNQNSHVTSDHHILNFVPIVVRPQNSINQKMHRRGSSNPHSKVGIRVPWRKSCQQLVPLHMSAKKWERIKDPPVKPFPVMITGSVFSSAYLKNISRGFNENSTTTYYRSKSQNRYFGNK